MQALGLLGSAFASILNPASILLMIAGVAIGIIFGSIPGLSASMAVALMLPLTFSMTPSLGMNTLVAVYIGGISGGLISAILLNMPGTASSIATCFDGHPMAKNGEAMKALGVGIVFSAMGSIFSFLILTFCAPLLADVALKFTPAENFGICFFALTMVAILSSGNMIRGLLAGMFGLMFTLVGMAPIDGTPRFTFGNTNLMAGFDTLPTLIGIFAIADILCTAESMKGGKLDTIPIKKVKGFGFSMQEFISWLPNFLRSSLIGTGIGILPGIGGSTSGMSAGPLLFVKNADVVYGIFAACIVCTLIMLVVEWTCIKGFVQVLKVPKHILLPLILVLCCVGAYATNNRIFDVQSILIFGLVGYIYHKFSLPTTPFVLCFLIGEMLETYLRRGIMQYKSFGAFFARPIFDVFFFIAIGVLVWTVTKELKAYKAKKQAA